MMLGGAGMEPEEMAIYVLLQARGVTRTASARSGARWRYQGIATGHMIPSSRPGDLIRTLLELA
jgi:hypothetical protein